MPARDVITYVGPGPAGLSVATTPAAGQPVCEEETGEFRGPLARLGKKKEPARADSDSNANLKFMVSDRCEHT